MRAVSGRATRALRTLAALGFLALGFAMLLAPVGSAQTGDESEDGAYAKLSKQGWWERKPNFPNVPATGLAVAAEGGADTRVTAIGIDMFVPESENLIGMTLMLTLRESTESGAVFPPITEQGQGQAQTKVNIVACPITSIWTPADGGDKAAGAPVADCSLARAEGIRRPDGSWNFDLTSLAELWASDTIDQNGLLLIERVDPPLSFNVSFQDLSTNTPFLFLETEYLEEDDTDSEDESFDETTDDTTTIDTGSSSGGDSFFSEVGEDVTGTTTTPFGITDTPPTTAPAAPSNETVDTTPTVSNRTPTKGSLPLGTLALVPLGLGLALLMGIVLGPEGDPVTARRREGGLSRALAQRSPAPE